mgnify:CR=1 FL=1
MASSSGSSPTPTLTRRPSPAGDGLRVSVGVGELPELDAIFLSYACALLDATLRTLRT